MIALSTEADRLLRSHAEASMWVQVYITSLTGGVFRCAADLLSLADSGCGPIRRSIRPLTREFEISLSGINLDNSLKGYTWRDAASPIYGLKLIGGLVEVDLMIPGPAATTEAYRLCTGVLSGMTLTGDGGCTLKLIDPQERLRQSSTGSKAGTIMHDDSPSGLIYTLMGSGYAGVDAAFIDTASFTAAALEERLDRHVVRGFEIGTGSWLDQINALLAYSSAVLPLDRYGKLSYFRMLPDVSLTPVTAIHDNDGIRSITLSKDLATVKNRAHVQRWNGSTYVATSSSPLGDADSITDFGDRWDRVRQFRYFDDDPSANLTAGQDVFYQSQPLEIVQVEADIWLFNVDVMDAIQVYASRLGLSGTVFRVFETTLNLAEQSVTLTAMNTVLDNQPWLITDNGHLLNGARKVF